MDEPEQERDSPHSVKKRISVTVSPYLKKRNMKCLEAEEFASESELVTVALSEFYGRYEHRKDFETIQKEIAELNEKLESLKKKVEENNKKR